MRGGWRGDILLLEMGVLAYMFTSLFVSCRNFHKLTKAIKGVPIYRVRKSV